MSKGRQTAAVTFPEFQQAQFQDIYNQAVGLANQPFIPYTGPQVAGFNPDELRAFESQRGLFNQAQEFNPFAARQQLIDSPTPSLLNADISSYSSPFQQQVIDATIGDIQRQADIQQQQAQDRAIRAGAFGGSRSAIIESESARPFAEQIARITPQLRQASFEQAQRAAEADIDRQLRQQAFRAGLIQQQELGREQAISGLLGTGGQQRALQQSALAAARGEFDRALNFPFQQFGLLSSAVSGIPQQPTTVTSGRAGSADVLGSLAGLLGSLAIGGVLNT